MERSVDNYSSKQRIVPLPLAVSRKHNKNEKMITRISISTEFYPTRGRSKINLVLKLQVETTASILEMMIGEKNDMGTQYDRAAETALMVSCRVPRLASPYLSSLVEGIALIMSASIIKPKG